MGFPKTGKLVREVARGQEQNLPVDRHRQTLTPGLWQFQALRIEPKSLTEYKLMKSRRKGSNGLTINSGGPQIYPRGTRAPLGTSARAHASGESRRHPRL